MICFTALVHTLYGVYCFLKIEYPVVWSVDEFCDGFFKLIDHLELDRVSETCFVDN